MSEIVSSFTGSAVFSGVVLPLALGFICALAGSWVLSLPLRRLPRGVHWSETARCFWPLRSSRMLIAVWITTAACLSSYGGLQTRDRPWMLVFIGISALAGSLLGSREAARGLRLPATARQGSWRSTVVWVLLFPVPLAMFGVIALTWYRGPDTQALMIAGTFLITCLGLCLGGSAAIVRAVGLARPVDEVLERSCREMAAARGLRLRHVMAMDLGMANAFVFPWTRDLAFTRTILAVLDGEELRSIIAHELGHLAEGRATRWKRLAGLLAVPTMGLAPAAVAGGSPGLALGLFATYYFLSRWVSGNHKRLETEADAHAGESQEIDGVYASALEKVHAASLIPAVMHPGHQYPNLYDRMTASGATPGFPRPAPPDHLMPMIICALTALAFLALWQRLGV